MAFQLLPQDPKMYTCMSNAVNYHNTCQTSKLTEVDKQTCVSRHSHGEGSQTKYLLALQKAIGRYKPSPLAFFIAIFLNY